MLRAFIFSTLGMVLCSCQTIEYRAEKSYCFADWAQKIPEDRQQSITTDFRYELQPTGTFTFKVTEEGNTVAIPDYKKVRIPYQIIDTFDANAKRRKTQIDACTKRACQKKFGNPACE